MCSKKSSTCHSTALYPKNQEALHGSIQQKAAIPNRCITWLRTARVNGLNKIHPSSAAPPPPLPRRRCLTATPTARTTCLGCKAGNGHVPGFRRSEESLTPAACLLQDAGVHASCLTSTPLHSGIKPTALVPFQEGPAHVCRVCMWNFMQSAGGPSCRHSCAQDRCTSRAHRVAASRWPTSCACGAAPACSPRAACPRPR